MKERFPKIFVQFIPNNSQDGEIGLPWEKSNKLSLGLIWDEHLGNMKSKILLPYHFFKFCPKLYEVFRDSSRCWKLTLFYISQCSPHQTISYLYVHNDFLGPLCRISGTSKCMVFISQLGPVIRYR